MKTKLLRKLRRRYRYVFNEAPYPDFLIDRKTKEQFWIAKPQTITPVRQLMLEMSVRVIGANRYLKLREKNSEYRKARWKRS